MEDLGKNSSIDQKINKSVSFYRVPSRRSKEDALDIVLRRIDLRKDILHSEIPLKIRFLRISMSAAATLLILLSSYFYFATASFTGTGKSSAFSLPDSSRIVLAGESTISFKKFVWNRRVKLTGNVYFEVEKGDRFKVYSKNGIVEVLGTRFSVADVGKSYSVECFEGQVNAKLKGEEVHLLTPGTALIEGKVKTIQEDPQKTGYPDFALFDKVYSGASLERVFPDLEDFFRIRIESSVDLNRQFSGSFKTGKPDKAISIICNALNLNYKIVGNQYFIFK